MADKFVICNNEDEIKSNESCYGNQTFELSEKNLILFLKERPLLQQ